VVNRSFRPIDKIRVVFDVSTSLLLVSAACHPAIFERLKEHVELPFFRTHQSGFTLDLANMTEQLVDSGLSFKQIKDLPK